MGKPGAESEICVRKSRSSRQEAEVEEVESEKSDYSGSEVEGESEEEDEVKGTVRVGSAVVGADSDDDLDSDGNGDDEEEEEEDAGGEEGNDPSASSGMSGEKRAPRDRQEEKKMSKMKKEALAYRQKLASRGVIYLSRVPPFMKPNKLRQLLSSYGDITRLFLQEEDASVRKRRKHGGGNGSKQFVEGWIEYSEKDTAKQVARALNNNRIGGKKGDFYYDDLWNLKYLKGFKWEFLTEKFAYERRVREAKLRQAMMTSRKVNAAFVEQVEKNKSRNHALERRRARGDVDGGDAGEGGANGERDLGGKKRKFRQERALASQHGTGSARMSDSVLENVFSSGKK